MSRWPSSRITILALLALATFGCKAGDRDAASSEEAAATEAATVDCQQVGFAAMEMLSARLSQRPWDPYTVQVLGQPKGCSSKRLDIYDLKTRERTAAVMLPSTGDDMFGWDMRVDYLNGNYMPLHGPSGRGHRLLLVHLPSGRIGYDSADAAERFASERGRLFTDLHNHVVALGDRMLMELNDGSVIEIDYEAKTTTPSTLTELPDAHWEAAEEAGCNPGSGNVDSFIDHPSRSPQVELDGAELGVHDVYWEGERGKPTLIYRDEDKNELFRIQDQLFHPEILRAAWCESRTSPVPLLVMHRANLDVHAADVLISRIDGTGAKRWTVTLPFRAQQPPIRWFDDTLVIIDSERGMSVSATWIDVTAGRIIETKRLGGGHR